MSLMTHKRELLIGTAFVAAIAALGTAGRLFERAAAQDRSGLQAPRFEVDPLWPRPLPNNWVLGQVIGLAVDARDHVWIVHRSNLLGANEAAADQNPPIASCCSKAPPVLEFDPAGNVVGHWGGPAEGYDWPESNHGIFVDHKENVWIGGNVGTDAHVLKFTRGGKFLAQFGRKGKNAGSNDMENFGRVAKIFVDARTNEAYIADGYGNRRVVVIDADTGKFKRYWGAYGHKPDDTDIGRYDPKAPPAQQFRTPVHCAISRPTGLSTSAIGRTIACRSSRPTARSSRKCSSRGTRSATDPRGTSRSRAIRSRSTSTSRTARTRRSTSCCGTLADPHELRRRRPPARTVLRRAQHRDGLEGERLHERDLRGTAGAEVRLQGHRRRHRARSGNRLAREVIPFRAIPGFVVRVGSDLNHGLATLT